MNTFDILWLAWPFIGLGGAIVILLLLLFSNAFRSDLSKPRYYDTTWLSWVLVFAYLLHVCEEYGMHIENGQFELITSFQEMGVDAKFGGLPLSFFPYMNIMLTWIALPAAAILSKKHPIIGLSSTGFLLVNGFTHIAGSAVLGMSLSENAGVVTGLLLFIPLFVWNVYACKKRSLLPEKGVGIIIASGVIGHLSLFLGYVLNMLFGHTVTYIFIPFVAFMPLIAAGVLCNALHVERK